jgi:hypothetical protein
MQLGVQDLLAQRDSVLKERRQETTERVRTVMAAVPREGRPGSDSAGSEQGGSPLVEHAHPRGCWEGLLRRLVGRPLRHAVSASDVATSPVGALRDKVSDLQSRADALRAQAKSSMASGRRADALAQLKRAKLLERQAESTGAAVTALEEQHLQLESAAITASITKAINKTVSKARKKHKGLLGQVDRAADGTTELTDLSQEVNDSLGSFATGGGYDDDELLEELQEMVLGVERQEVVGVESDVESARPSGASPSAATSAWPQAPTRDVGATRQGVGEGQLSTA